MGKLKEKFKRKSVRKQNALERKLRATLRNATTRIRVRSRKNLPTRKLKEQKENLENKIRILDLLETERKEQQKEAIDGDGFARWTDGTMVAAWMMGLAPGPDGHKVNWLQRYVNHGWDGNLSSGGRSPEYSETLCFRMCGAPSCSGKCAGRASNHAGSDGPGKKGNDSWGAIDVFPEYVKFEQIGMRIDSPLINRLDYRDPVHFSVTGN